MSVEVAVYAPELNHEPQPAPLACLRQLFNELAKRDEIQVTHIHHGDPIDWNNTLHVPKLPGQCERRVNQYGFDVVHFNSFVNIVNPILLSSPTILTYHGDVHWELPGLSGSRFGDLARRVLERIKLPQFDHVQTVSSDLERRVQDRYRLFGIDSTTVYNGIDQERFSPTGPNIPKKYDIETPYVLHVSNYAEKKNPGGILRAYDKVSGNFDVALIICGGGWQNNDTVTSLIKELEIQGEVSLLGYIPDEILPAFYRQANVFLYPSFHETFGLPIVEAMASGTPVVTADRYAPPEIADGAALTCDPNSYDEIAEALLSLLRDPDLAATLRERGLERAEDFNWSSAADQVLNIYDSMGLV